jgi:hypothetical protein
VSKRSRNRLEQEKIAQQKVEATREKIEDLEKKGYQLRLAGFQDESEEVDNFNVNWRVNTDVTTFSHLQASMKKSVKIVPVPLYRVSKKTLRKFNRLSCIVNLAKQFNFYIGRKSCYLASL